jgi:predicted RNase H-like HicB family nuclease
MSKTTYLVHLELTRKGGFVVTVPSLPGCQATAATFAQVIDAAKAAIEARLKALAKIGAAIPVESKNSQPVCLHVAAEVPKQGPNRRRR